MAHAMGQERVLLANDLARVDRSIAVGDFFEVIDQAEVDIFRQEVLTDAFGDVGIDLVLVEDAGLLVLLEHRPVGVDAPHLDLRVALLEVAADAGRTLLDQGQHFRRVCVLGH